MISEFEWIKWVRDFADIAVQENTDLKLRMNLLKKAARYRLAELQDEEYRELMAGRKKRIDYLGK